MYIAGPEGLEELLAVGGTTLDRGGLCIAGEVFVPTSSRCKVVALVQERSEFATQGRSETPPAEV